MTVLASPSEKERIKRELAASLSGEREVRRIVIFGSFLTEPAPRDLDVAIFQDSQDAYLPLALKYRRIIRPIARQIPVDVIPLRAGAKGGAFLAEIEQGEVIYES